jgi:integrase
MATVLRRKNSAYWRAYWRDANGKLRGRSTKQTSRSKALRMALEFERIDRELRRGRMAAQQAQRVVSDLVRELGLVVDEVPTIREWFDLWLKDRTARVRDGTAINYKKSVLDLLTFLKVDADRPLPILTADRVQAWVNSLAERGLAAGTVKIYFEPIRAASTKAWKRGYLTADVASGIDRPKGKPAERDAFSPSEIDALLSEADDEWKVVILAGALAGLRISDAAGLTWKSVDLAKGVLHLTQQKTDKAIVIPLHARLRAHLEKLAGDVPDAPLCPSLKDMDTRGSNGLSGTFKAIMRRAGVTGEDRGAGKRKVSSKSAHSLRHTFVRLLLANGVDESVRMKLAGHASKSAHQIYAQADLDQLRKAVDAIP